jgi:hypothetical protein
LRILESRFLMDWSPGLALIPMIIGMMFVLSGSDITQAASAEISVVGPGLGIIFTIIAFLIHGLFWINMGRVTEKVESLTKIQGYGLGVVALGGLLVVGFVDGGWIIFALAQFGLAYAIYKSHMLTNAFAIVTGFFGAVNVLFGILGFADTTPTEVPVFAFMGWSLIMLVFSLTDGHPEDREMDYEARFRRGAPDDRVASSIESDE